VSLVVFLLALVLCALLGRGWLGWLAGADESRGFRVGLAIAAGIATLHLTLTALQLAGLPWRRGWLLAAAALCVLLTWRLPRPVPRRPAARRPALAWGSALAAAAVLVFAVFAWRLWILFPDFIYHWGIKAQKFLLAQGVDYLYLARPWNWRIHPDYPNLLPELYAVTGILGGAFREPAAMLWSVLFLALAALGVRQALAAGGASRFTVEAGTASFAAAAAAFGIGYRMGGAADWAMAAALALAAPALLRPPRPETDAQIGLAAALGAAAKIEGVALALLLVGAQLVRRWLHDRRIGVRALAAIGLAPALVIAAWLWGCLRHGLFLPTNAGLPSPERALPLLGAYADALLLAPWHGFDLVALGVPPLLLLSRRLRPLAAVAVLQLVFYSYVYLSAPLALEVFVPSNFPRLLLHLLPAAMAGGLLALEQPQPEPA
jgi:hypothetical protein